MRRAAAIAWSAWRGEREAPTAPMRSNDERAFLPAALEIIETPASPAAHWTALTLIAFFVIVVAWAWYGQVDVVAVAEGRVMPSDRTKVIQPLETGVIRAIRVRDGMSVRQGDVLVELDPTDAGAVRERLAQELVAARITVARIKALLADPTPRNAVRAFQPPPEADAVLITTQRKLLVSEAEEFQAKLAQLADELKRRQAEQAATQTAIRRLDETIPLLRERVEARGDLADKGYGSRLQYLEVKQQLVEQEQERNIQRHRLQEAAAIIAALKSQSKQVEAEFRRTKTAELNEAERRADSTAQELVRADQRHKLQTLTAPIDGVVQQLAIHTVSGIVTPAQQLMVIVPTDGALEVEAMLPNKDIGFVQAGQRAEIKLETFNFTRYGTIAGDVTSVSGDAILDEKKGPIYAARVRLSRTSMDIDGQAVRLAPGMNVTVEIKTDQRRIIDNLLAPLLRYKSESLRER